MLMGVTLNWEDKTSNNFFLVVASPQIRGMPKSKYLEITGGRMEKEGEGRRREKEREGERRRERERRREKERGGRRRKKERRGRRGRRRKKEEEGRESLPFNQTVLSMSVTMTDSFLATLMRSSWVVGRLVDCFSLRDMPLGGEKGGERGKRREGTSSKLEGKIRKQKGEST
jgi:hypothetical protein